MKRIPTLVVKWLANKLGYKVAMLKAVKGTTTIEGDKELLRYVDITGYLFKKEPLSRIKPSKTPKHDALVTKLTSEQLRELGL